MKRMKLRSGIALLLVALLFVSLVLNASWSTYAQRAQAEREMLEKSQILARQMGATWDFVDINQERIDTDSDGSYNFKGIYCAIAGKGIGKLFSHGTDYVIRYVKVDPRQKSAAPDEFEQMAFDSFDKGASEFYSITRYDDGDVFRYVMPLKITESCLACHGEPAGEIDVTGYPKEGAQIGEIGGAISIVMPIDLYLSSIQSNIVQQSAFFFILVSLFALAVYGALSRFVTRPLNQLATTVDTIEAGNLNVSLGETTGAMEVRKLASKFSSMALRLQELYEGLERQVETRTEQLAAANEELDRQRRQLEEANEQLAETNLRLQDESQYKSDFLAIMSHELRTPLTSIIAFTEIWEKTNYDKDDGEKMAVREIKESGLSLLHMVDNILEVARMEAGKTEIHYEPIDLVDLMTCVKGVVDFLAEKKSIDLKCVIHRDVPIIEADWDKLRRVVENLVSNAVKFTDENGSVHVEVGYRPEDDLVVITVSDSGIGIREEDVSSIFDKFVQSDHSECRRYGGSGLGLSVVKDLVAAHGGEVEAESIYGHGSTFRVLLPSHGGLIGGGRG